MDLDGATSEILNDWKVGEELDSSGSSPESRSSSSVDSVCSSPEMFYSGGHRELAYGSPERGRCTGPKAAPRTHGKAKMSTKRRVKASEREKMRMRSLAEALHQLRDYLPPDYTTRGQPLTKIQTLKYTIEYIKKLSDILNRA